MSLPLRITFNDTDYTFTVLTRGINKETTAVKISLLGEEFTIVRNQQHQWHALETSIGDKDDLLRAIAKNVALRYRL
jgi:hypothetical protein